MESAKPPPPFEFPALPASLARGAGRLKGLLALETQQKAAARVEWFLSRTDGERYYTVPALDDAIDSELAGMRPNVQNSTLSHLSQFVVKAATDCNLRCIYPCYEYVDDDWKKLPPYMTIETGRLLGRRLGEYCSLNGILDPEIVWHGGEPLSMKEPERFYGDMIPVVRAAFAESAPSRAVLSMGIQTNAMFIRRPVMNVFNDHDVSVGVSIDGDEASHNARRRTKHGQRPSYTVAMRGVDLLRTEYPRLFRRALGVVYIDADPFTYLDGMIATGAPEIDLLLPYATHDDPPPSPTKPGRRRDAPYAEWLLNAFWYWKSMPEAPDVRYFRSAMQLALGGQSDTEGLGPDAGGEVVVRTDGSIELLDARRVTGQGMVNTDMHLKTHTIEEAADFLRANHLLGKKLVPEDCRDCPMFDRCGSGHPVQTYSTERGFDNASVYCNDHYVFVREVTRATQQAMRSGMTIVQLARQIPRYVPESGCNCC